MTFQSATLVPPNSAHPLNIRPEVVRKSIDLIATLRARNVRVGYLGMAYHRPDPDKDTPQDVLDEYLSSLIKEVSFMTKLVDLLAANKPVDEIPTEMGKWMHAIAVRKPEKLAQVFDICRMAQDIVAAATIRSPKLGQVLDAHRTESRKHFFELITQLCDGFWRDYGAAQVQELEAATTAAKALAKRLERLERIGKHVRLVSLNASVEAARAGDVGKGLMVIAQEFKTLAEEIQTLAKDARADADEIT